jgi:uracil DNA glycosylase
MNLEKEIQEAVASELKKLCVKFSKAPLVLSHKCPPDLKVKKIEWEKTVIGLHATLPMQLHARISKQGELYKWAIMRGTLSIVTYFTKSEEQAKKDCQKAWEDMVMECLEPVKKSDKLGC